MSRLSHPASPLWAAPASRRYAGLLFFSLLLGLSSAHGASATTTTQATDRLTTPTIISYPFSSRDSDGDGYLDGPDSWAYYPNSGSRILIAGEDKNGNGKIELAGADGIAGNSDDESEPNNPQSIPRSEVILKIDSDSDGLGDDMEERDHLDPFDRDSDDDGLSDGWEVEGKTKGLGPYVYELDVDLLQGINTNPRLPDSDWDGRPDGLEVGVSGPIPRAGTNNSQKLDTDLNAVYTLYEEDGVERPGIQKCFVADSDGGNPGTATSPLLRDSNRDGKSDLMQDINSNGAFDPGEEDPVFGIWCEPLHLASSQETIFVRVGTDIEPNGEHLVFKSGMQTGQYSIEIPGDHMEITPANVTMEHAGSEVSLETRILHENTNGKLIIRNSSASIVYQAILRTGPAGY